MIRRLSLAALLPLTLLAAGCAPSLPDLDATLTPASRTADYPQLVPLGPVLAEVDALLPREAMPVSTGLEARVADLRRRAAALRRMPIS